MTRRLITGILEGGKVTTTTGTVKESGGSTTPEFANIQEQSIGLQRSRSHTLQDYEDASWFSYDGRGQAGYEVQELVDVLTVMHFMIAKIVLEEDTPIARNMSPANLAPMSFSWDWIWTSQRQT